ncbi:MAG: hypothetical protein IT204_13275 [Fimbriimonadaceae bacterium]|nr:hypothetical protein [Fimbriimonadaceae bacterium]
MRSAARRAYLKYPLLALLGTVAATVTWWPLRHPAAAPVAAALAAAPTAVCGAWLPSGGLALATADGQLQLHRGTQHRLLEQPLGPLSKLVASPAGDRLLLLSQGGQAALLELPGGLLQVLETPGGELADGAFSPDGAYLTLATATGELALWQTCDGLLTTVGNTFSEDRAALRAVGFSPGGDFLAAVTATGWWQLWQVEPAADLPPGLTQLVDRPVSLVGGLNALAWDTTGDHLLVGGDDGCLRRYRLADGQLEATCVVGTPVRALSFDATSGAVLAGGLDGTLARWAADGQVQRWRDVGDLSWLLALPGASAAVAASPPRLLKLR